MTKLADCVKVAVDATKGNAKALVSVLLSFRNDKQTAGRLVNKCRKELNALVVDASLENSTAVEAMLNQSEMLKQQLSAAVDRDLARAIMLRKIPRGTTGKGRLHHSDVVTEILGSTSRAVARANNDVALRAMGEL